MSLHLKAMKVLKLMKVASTIMVIIIKQIVVKRLPLIT